MKPDHALTPSLLARTVALSVVVAGTSPLLGGGEETVPLRNWQAPSWYALPADSGPDLDGRSEATALAPGVDSALLATSTLAFVGITPCRVADTRQPPPGEFGQPWMPASTVRSFTLTGQCAIPAGAEAVSFNFTVTNTAGAGFLLVYPAGGQVPGVSTLNYLGAQTIANAAVVPLGTLGGGRGISVIPGVAGFDLIIDVNGYYAVQGVVSSLNGTTGAVSITAGSNVAVTPSGQNVQLSAGPLVSSLEGLSGIVDVAPINGTTVTAGSGTLTLGTNATSVATAGAIVMRDGSAAFAAGTIDLTGTPYLLSLSGGTRLLHQTGNSTNLFFGPSAGGPTSAGTNHTAFGWHALAINSSGSSNTAFGAGALAENETGGTNAAFGSLALTNSQSGSSNAAFGHASLNALTTGAENVAVGRGAGGLLQSGDNNVYVGTNVFASVADESNTIRIGNSSATATYVRGVSGASVGTASAVYVNSSGRLGTVTSSARFKDDVADLTDPSPLLQALRPVSFVYRTDETRTPQAGLIAEEVERIAPYLVTRDEEGRLLSVRYDQLVPMLLAEVKRLEARDADLSRTLSTVLERLRQLESAQPGR